MKRRAIIILGLLLVVGNLSACQGSKGEKASNSSTSSMTSVEGQKVYETTKEAQEDGESKEDYPEGLEYLYTEENFNYSIMLANAQNTSLGYSHVSKAAHGKSFDRANCEQIFVTQYSGDIGAEEEKEIVDMTKYQSSEDIFDLLSPVMNARFWYGYNGYSNVEYDVKTIETIMLNGFEMTKYEGTAKCTLVIGDEGYEFTHLIVAYGIAGTKTPVLVCCADFTEEQDQHEYWVDKIDELVATYTEN